MHKCHHPDTWSVLLKYSGLNIQKRPDFSFPSHYRCHFPATVSLFLHYLLLNRGGSEFIRLETPGSAQKPLQITSEKQTRVIINIQKVLETCVSVADTSAHMFVFIGHICQSTHSSFGPSAGALTLMFQMLFCTLDNCQVYQHCNLMDNALLISWNFKDG